jgi:hypothetical protein
MLIIERTVMPYTLIRRALFCLDPETAHDVTFRRLLAFARQGVAYNFPRRSLTLIHFIGFG